MRRLVLLLLITTVGALGMTARAAYVPVFGGPEYDVVTQSGYQSLTTPQPFQRNLVNNSGTALATLFKTISGDGDGQRPLTWRADGTAPLELSAPAIYGSDTTNRWAYAINDNGAVVGAAHNDTFGERPIRWNASGEATELGNLGTRSGSTFTWGQAYAINNAGNVAGYTVRWASGSFFDRAIRWGASGTAATELDDLSPGSQVIPRSRAYAINETGTVVGYAQKLAGGVLDRGTRAVRWNGGGTAILELGNLGTTANGTTTAEAYDVNESGTAVGFANKYVGGVNWGPQAVRWDADSGAATELDSLVSNPVQSRAYAINDAGTAVGFTPGTNGFRAVRWDPGGSALTQLGDFGALSNGQAFDINNDGTIVGTLTRVINGTNVSRATAWRSNAVAIDLNVLIDPASGWTLTSADSISNMHWITGRGGFDPDGPGPLAAYTRRFTLQLSEPLPGDYNADFVVDAADYTYWRDHLDQMLSLTGESPTATTPGYVDAEDYEFWKLHFGASLNSGPASSHSIPEPSTWLLAILAASLATVADVSSVASGKHNIANPVRHGICALRSE